MIPNHTANEKSPSVASTGPFENHTANDLDYPTSTRPGKEIANIKALFALRGHAVHDGGNQDFIVVHQQWGHSRHCPDYSALIRFGRQLGVLA